MQDEVDTIPGISREWGKGVHRKVIAYRVDVIRNGKKLYRYFSFRKHGGEDKALEAAKDHRKKLLKADPIKALQYAVGARKPSKLYPGLRKHHYKGIPRWKTCWKDPVTGYERSKEFPLAKKEEAIAFLKERHEENLGKKLPEVTIK